MAPNVEIEYLLNQYKEAINTSDAKLAESLYTIDNKHYPVDVSSTITSESILEHYENLFAQNDMNIDLFIEEISLEDNMACVITTSIGMLHFFCDENKVPEKIKFNAEDGGVVGQETKAIMMSVWDPKKKDTLRIDLWTKDMPVDEMKQFFHQTLVSMASSFERATDDQKMTATMRDFCDYFAEKLELKK